MSEDMKVVVGCTAEDDDTAFLNAVERADRGEHVHERVLSFQSWEDLASVMTGCQATSGTPPQATPDTHPPRGSFRQNCVGD